MTSQRICQRTQSQRAGMVRLVLRACGFCYRTNVIELVARPSWPTVLRGKSHASRIGSEELPDS